MQKVTAAAARAIISPSGRRRNKRRPSWRRRFSSKQRGPGRPAYAASTAPVKTPCTIRRTRRGTGSFHRHKGHDDPRRQCWLSRRVARAASPAATPPCGYGLSRNRQLLGAVTSNPPSPALTCVSTIRQLPKYLNRLWVEPRGSTVVSGMTGIDAVRPMSSLLSYRTQSDRTQPRSTRSAPLRRRCDHAGLALGSIQMVRSLNNRSCPVLCEASTETGKAYAVRRGWWPGQPGPQTI